MPLPRHSSALSNLLRRTGALVLASLALRVAGVRAEPRHAPGAHPLPASVPHYRFALSYGEFAVVQDAARSAMENPGEEVELRVDLGRSGDDVVWNVTIDDAKLMDLLDHELSDRVSHLRLDADSARTASGASVRDRETLPSARDRVHEARLAPGYDLTTIEGTLRNDHGRWSVRDADRDVPLGVGTELLLPEALVDHDVVVTGFVREAGTLEVLRLVEKRANTLDLFVMSLCPFARRAEASILPRLTGTSGASASMRVHYIFYAPGPGSHESFTCMHGDAEVRENLVQMLLRDEHPRQFASYLQLRTVSDEPWESLAARAGVDGASVLRIAHRVESDRNALIAREYAYVARQCGVRDGSPTIVWEGRSVERVSEVPLLAGLATTGDRCGGTP